MPIVHRVLGTADRDVADERDERKQPADADGAEHDPPAASSENDRSTLVSRGDERGEPTEEPGERDRGQLPVPVVCEVHDQPRVGPKRDWNE